MRRTALSRAQDLYHEIEVLIERYPHECHNLVVELIMQFELEVLENAAEAARRVGRQYGDCDPSRDGRVVGNAVASEILRANEPGLEARNVKPSMYVPSMNIYTPPGSKVAVLNYTNGTPADHEQLRMYGVLENVAYTVKKINVYEFVSHVVLAEFPETSFNTVNFRNV